LRAWRPGTCAGGAAGGSGGTGATPAALAARSAIDIFAFAGTTRAATSGWGAGAPSLGFEPGFAPMMNSPQKRHLIAAFLIFSAQKGHSFMSSSAGGAAGGGAGGA
jgi:hypothetical protein